jgi:hypothetical protein
MLLQNLHGLNEDGSKPVFTVQVLLNSSEKFGPANVRELSVRASLALSHALPRSGRSHLPHLCFVAAASPSACIHMVFC